MAKQDISISALVDKINAGDMILPEMQRKYVWTAKKVSDLLDSLYRNYPSGSILVWETDALAPTRNLAVDQAQSALTTKLLLLDGQQRLTSLTAIVSGKPINVKDRKRPIEIMFNLDHPDLSENAELHETIDDDDDSEDGEETISMREMEPTEIQEYLKKKSFIVHSKALEAVKTWVKVNDIFQKNDSAILKAIGINSDHPLWDKYTERLHRVRKIKDYLYVMHILGKEYDYTEVTDIFVRVNSSGVTLKGSDLALAQITAKWHGSLKQFEEFSDECKRFGFDLDLGTLVRTLIVFTTGQSRFKTVGGLKVDNLKTNWEDTKKGIQFALNFLKNNTDFESLDFLSSAALIIPAALYANMRDENITAEDENHLRSWLYLAHSFAHYSKGSSESLLDFDINILKKKKEPLKELISVLEQQFGRLSFTEADLFGKGQRSPLFSMAYISVKRAEGKDWFTGLKLNSNTVGHNHKIEYHHIFPRKLLRDAGFEKAEINEIANMAFIGGRTNRKISSKSPEEYLKDIIEKRGEEALKSQFVPTDPKLWKIENYREFLKFRRTALISEINKFMDLRKIGKSAA